MRKARGVALGTALLVALIITTLGFALSGASITHLRLNTRLTNSEQASNLARSVVAKGVDRLFKDDDYGKSRTDTPLDISLQGPIEGSRGLLTFDKNAAAQLGIPFSTNNLEGSAAELGPDGQSIPVDKVHLVGVGRVGNVEKRIDVIIHIPPYPYAVSSEGPIHALRGARVGGLDELPSNMVIPTDFSDVNPADIVSNGTTDDAIRLGDGTEVTGDVLSAGGIQLEANDVLVKGELRPNQSPADLPAFELGRYDPDNIGLHETLNRSSYSGGNTFEGMIRRQGDVRFTGGVELREGLLFVDGDVTISGGLSGSGLIVTTGSLTVDGGARLVADSKVALLAEGDVILNGSGAQSSYFQGTIFTKSGVQAEDLTVVGTLIAAGRNDAVRLDNARLFTLPESGERLSWEVAGATTTTTSTGEPQFTMRPSSWPASTGVGVNITDNGNDTINIEISYRINSYDFDLPANSSGRTIGAHVYQNLRRIGVNALAGAARSAWLIAIGNQDWTGARDAALTASAGGGSTQTTTSPPSVIVVDPSEFLSIKDKARILLWKES